MNCPVCAVTLQLAERQGVEIDYCPKCRGVWLDRGEIDKIVERSMAAAGGASGAAYGAPPRRDDDAYERRRDDDHDGDHDRRYEGDPRRRRRGSWLGELLGGGDD